jgi:hypothetical protein
VRDIQTIQNFKIIHVFGSSFGSSINVRIISLGLIFVEGIRGKSSVRG